MWLRFTKRWSERVPEWKAVARGLIPFQWASIAITTDHFFFNQMGILFVVFSFLLTVGGVTAVLPTFGWPPSVGATRTVPSSRRDFDSPAVYLVKSLGFGLVCAFGIKAASVYLLAGSPWEHSPVIALTVAGLLSVASTIDLFLMDVNANKDAADAGIQSAPQ